MSRRHSPFLVFAARAGYGARGVLYLLIGGLAVLAAFNLRMDPVGARGALRVLFAQPSGAILLGALASGFMCFAAWRLIQAWTDPSGYGGDMKGLSIRAMLGASALAHAGIAVAAVRLMLGWVGNDEPEGSSVIMEWFTSIMAAPFGPWVAGGIGLAVVGAGVIKITKAWRADLGEHLKCADSIRLWAIPVSRFGLTARGAIFIMIGSSMIWAAYHLQADRAAGLAGILRSLERTPFGWVLLATAALGLAAFGVFGLIEALYRRIESRDID